MTAAILTSAEALAAPALVDPSSATLELVTPSAAEQAKLDQVDGLAFDAFGNLLAALEIFTDGAIVYIDKATGIVTTLLTNIDHPDQIALDASGDMWFELEVTPASTSNRIFRMTVGYDGSNRPIAAGSSATSLTTSTAINNPEGLVVLESDGPYGNAGDLLIAEDVNPGAIFRVQPGTGTTTTLASGLSRPEGAAFGSFAGQLPDALYVAETNTNSVKSIAADGTVAVFGEPGAVGLTSPDNVRFGPDGYLYVSEDRSEPNGRILRIASDGTHSVFATGFGQAQGMIFDANGDLYIAEQDLDRIWRVRFLGCGDGTVDGGEDCDNGASNGTPGQCCSATCSFEAAATECRASADVCDLAEQCTGTGASCPADSFESAGTECRASADVCDVAEQCTGAGAACPADGFVSAGVECRAVAGVCDVVEQCTGAGPACPADGFVAPFTLCRGSVGACDAIELCTGTGPACPADGFVIAGIECRASADACDLAEQCTGTAASCPADGFAPGSTPCDDGVACTEGETCDGAGACQGGTPNDGLCDDAFFCNGAESCDPLLDCQVGTPPPGDGVSCTDDVCDEVLDVVTSVANSANCDNGQFCDGDEYCDPLLDCQPGQPPELAADGVTCTDAVCDEQNDRIEQVPVDTYCVNSSLCDGAEWCNPIFGCQPAFQALDCDDGDACTADSCDAVSGCLNVPLLNCIEVPAASPGGRALLGLLVVSAGVLLLSRRRSRTS